MTKKSLELPGKYKQNMVLKSGFPVFLTNKTANTIKAWFEEWFSCDSS
jgi:hypothetical protein